MVDIQCKDGKYIIDARIHSEVDTNDIAKVQERFTSDCAYEFAEAMREAVNVSHLVMKEQKEILYSALWMWIFMKGFQMSQ